MHILFDNSCGIAIFETNKKDISEQIRSKYEEYLTITQNLKLISFYEFKGTDEALEYFQSLSNGTTPEILKNILEINQITEFISELNPNIFKEYTVKLDINLIRGIRRNQHKLLKIDKQKIKQSSLALSHAISRNKIEMDIYKSDVSIIVAIDTIEQQNKDINTYYMRIKEIYSWYLPELEYFFKGGDYIKAVFKFKKIKELSDDEIFRKIHDLLEEIQKVFYEGNEILVNDVEESFELIKEKLLESIRNSIGSEICESDWKNLERITEICEEKIENRNKMVNYLKFKISEIAPNLNALLGEILAGKFISKAGGLDRLSKLPSSTIQLLGAEKALFRALKKRTNTPKYGMISNSTFANQTHEKGKICRFLASKIAILSRIDCYGDKKTDKYGKEIKKYVEKKIESLKNGNKIETTDEVLERVYESLKNGNIKIKKNSKCHENGENYKNLKIEGLMDSKEKKIKNKNEKKIVEEMENDSKKDGSSKKNVNKKVIDLENVEVKPKEKIQRKAAVKKVVKNDVDKKTTKKLKKDDSIGDEKKKRDSKEIKKSEFKDKNEEIKKDGKKKSKKETEEKTKKEEEISMEKEIKKEKKDGKKKSKKETKDMENEEIKEKMDEKKRIKKEKDEKEKKDKKKKMKGVMGENKSKDEKEKKVKKDGKEIKSKLNKEVVKNEKATTKSEKKKVSGKISEESKNEENKESAKKLKKEKSKSETKKLKKGKLASQGKEN